MSQRLTLFLTFALTTILFSFAHFAYASDLYTGTIVSEPSLLSFYQLDEAGGASTVIDTTGAHNLAASAVTFGQTSLLGSGFGTAALFNGSSGKLTATSSSVFGFERTQAFSFEFIVKPNVTRSGSDNEYAVVSDINTSSPFNGYEVQLVYNNYGDSKTVLRVLLINNFGSGNYIDVHGSTDLKNGTIYHVVVTYNGSGSANGVHIYVNGVGETVTTSTNGLTSSITSPQLFNVGARQASRFLPATLDELSIYNSALSLTQVDSHFAASITIPAILTFSAMPSTIIGTSTSSIISWSVVNASSTTITPGSFSTTSSVGTLSVSPTSTTIYTITAANGSGTATATTTVVVGPTDPVPPVPVILDTDLSSDVDDVGDLTALNSLANRGDANILAVITDSANAYSAPAAKAFLNYFGKGSTPIGAYQGSTPSGAAAGSPYTQTITNNFGAPGDTRSNYPNATTTYRQVLAAAANDSVVIVDTGFFEPLEQLLQTPADGISSLTGAQLVAQKVKRLVVVAGIYPSGLEYNMQQDPGGANYVFANWPTEIVSVGIELGNTVFTAPPSSESTTTNPVAQAFYLASSLLTNGQRQAWGQLGILYGIRGLSTNFNVLGLLGTNAVNGTTGANSWTQTPNSNQSYLGKVTSDSALENILNPLLNSTPPSVSLTAPITNSTISGANVTLTASSTDLVAITGVQFKVDGANVGSSGSSSPYSITWNSASVPDGPHVLSAIAADGAGNIATSSVNVTVRNNPPVISVISSGTPTATAATIIWTTNESATSKVVYGATTAYGSASSSASLVTSHSITLTGLTFGAAYHYAVVSTDSVGNTATSSDQTFTTADVTPPAVSLTVVSAGNGAPVGSLGPGNITGPFFVPPTNTAPQATVPSQSPAATFPTQSPATPLHLIQNHRLYDVANDIRTLQQFLNARGFIVAESGPGSTGHETSFFGLKTYRALVDFQKASSLPATGYLGPLTRALIEKLTSE